MQQQKKFNSTQRHSGQGPDINQLTHLASDRAPLHTATTLLGMALVSAITHFSHWFVVECIDVWQV